MLSLDFDSAAKQELPPAPKRARFNSLLAGPPRPGAAVSLGSFGSLASAKPVMWNASMSGHVCRQQLTLTRKRPHVCTPEPVGCSCLFAQAAADPEKLDLALPEASTQLIQFVMWNATTCGHVCRQQLTLTRKRPDVCTPEPVGCSCLFAQTAADPQKLASALPGGKRKHLFIYLYLSVYLSIY